MSDRLKSFALAGAILALAGGAVADDGPPRITLQPDLDGRLADAEGRSAYGLFLAGRSAVGAGETALAADYFGQVVDIADGEARVRQQAFTAALLAGDVAQAAATAPTGDELPPVLIEAGRLATVVHAFADGRARDAHRQLQAAPIAEPHARAGRFIAPWIAAAAGDWDTALAPVEAGSDARTAVFARFQRAQLLEARGRRSEADAAYAELVAASPDIALFRSAYGAFLERTRRRDAALAVYQAEGRPQGRVEEGIERLSRNGRPPALPGLRERAGAALTAAATAAIGDRAYEFAIAYLHMSLALNDDEGARLLLGQTLTEAGMSLPARLVYAEVSPDQPEFYAQARMAIAYNLEAAGEAEAAVAEARRALAAAPDAAATHYGLAGLLMQTEQFDAALELLNGPVLNTANQGPDVRFLRGAAYESVGRVPEAEAELWAALQAAPNDPNILNYLGYLWVDRGGRVEEGAEMIARAFAAAPDNGNIQDSLGWAQYRQGQYEAAVQTLEGAVAKEPANAEIVGHLADAYWQVGRRREAGFLWSRVLTLDADEDQRAAAEAKLEVGLDAYEARIDAAGGGAPVQTAGMDR